MEKPPKIEVLSENEQIVRAYRCTKLRRLFAKPVTGYLSVTNKRIIYHSQGKGIGGENSVISEMPLEDIAGISTYAGSSFNFLLFFLFSICIYSFSTYIDYHVPALYWVFGILLCIPILIGLIFKNKILSQSIVDSLRKKINNSFIGDWVTNKPEGYFWSAAKICLYVGSPMLAFKLTNIPIIGLLLVLVVYYFIFVNVFGKFRTFSLQIRSRTTKGAGIIIPGDFIFALLGGNTAAVKTMFSGPDEDANLIVRDLGAMVLDIQQMGDLGITKWKK